MSESEDAVQPECNFPTDPPYAELAAHYRKLLRVALNINDHMRIDVDAPVFSGSTNDVDDLREAVNEHLHDWCDFIYPVTEVDEGAVV